MCDTQSYSRILISLFLGFIARHSSESLSWNYTFAFTQSLGSYIDNTHFVVINTALDNASIQVTLPNDLAREVQYLWLTPGEARNISVAKEYKLSGTNVESKGIRIEASSEVTVVCFNRLRYTNTGFFALPDHALGLEYIIVTYCQDSYNCLFAVVATEAETVVHVHLGNNSIYQISIGSVFYSNGRSFTFNLQYLQTFQAMVAADLSGTRITSTKPIAVFSGNDRSKLIAGNVDAFSDEVPPINRLGKYFVLVNINFTANHYAKFLSTVQNSIVSVCTEDGCTVEVLKNPGDVKLQPLTKCIVLISSNEPLLVAHYIKDPKSNTAMYFAHSLDELDTQYVTYAYGNATDDGNVYTEYNNYVILIVRRSERSGLRDKGATITTTWFPVLNTSYDVTILPVSPGFHHFYHESLDVPFGGYLFGYAMSECYAVVLGYNRETSQNELSTNPTWTQQATTETQLSVSEAHNTGDNSRTRVRNYVEDAMDTEPSQIPMMTIETKSKVDCATHCTVNRDRCSSFSFELSSGSCSLFASIHTNLDEKVGTVYMKYLSPL